MPNYCYTGRFCLQYGETREYHFPMGQAPEVVFDEDLFFGVRDIPAEHRGSAANRPGTGWPLHCEASGVHPSQVQQARETMAQRGVPTDYDRHGRAIYTDRKHRARALKALGIFDKSAGYSDPAP